MLEEPTRVVVHHHFYLMRRGMCLVLADDARLQVCGEAATERELEQLVQRHRPHVAFVHVVPPYATALAWVRRLCTVEADLGVVACAELTDDLVQRLLVAGVRGVVSLDVREPEVLQAALSVGAGGMHRNAWLRGQWSGAAQEKAERQRAQAAVVDLSPREEQVLALVCHPAGTTRKAMAARLQVAESTVDLHMRNLFRKFGVASSTALVRAAMVKGRA